MIRSVVAQIHPAYPYPGHLTGMIGRSTIGQYYCLGRIVHSPSASVVSSSDRCNDTSCLAHACR